MTVKVLSNNWSWELKSPLNKTSRTFRIHYIEYLVRKIRSTQLEPLPLLNVDDLETCVRRAGSKLPPNWYGRDPEHYRRDLNEVKEGLTVHGPTKFWVLFPAGSTTLSTWRAWYWRASWIPWRSLTWTKPSKSCAAGEKFPLRRTRKCPSGIISRRAFRWLTDSFRAPTHWPN